MSDIEQTLKYVDTLVGERSKINSNYLHFEKNLASDKTRKFITQDRLFVVTNTSDRKTSILSKVHATLPIRKSVMTSCPTQTSNTPIHNFIIH